MTNITNLWGNLEIYQSIDELPIYNWFKINETNDLTFMLKKGKRIPKTKLKGVEIAFKNIFREFIDTFGIPDKMREIYELKKDIASNNYLLVITQDRSIETTIDILEYQLKKLYEEEVNNSINPTINAEIAKYMGFRIDERLVTVKEYYGYIEKIKQDALAQKAGIKPPN